MTREEQLHHQLLRIVKLSLTLNVALYSIDEFADTPLYSHELKNSLKHASKLLERKNNTLFGLMYKADEQQTAESLKEYEYVIDQITRMIAAANIDDIQAIHDGLKKYYEDKASLVGASESQESNTEHGVG